MPIDPHPPEPRREGMYNLQTQTGIWFPLLGSSTVQKTPTFRGVSQTSSPQSQSQLENPPLPSPNHNPPPFPPGGDNFPGKIHFWGRWAGWGFTNHRFCRAEFCRVPPPSSDPPPPPPNKDPPGSGPPSRASSGCSHPSPERRRTPPLGTGSRSHSPSRTMGRRITSTNQSNKH